MRETRPAITFIDERSKEIYEKKKHALIGISPCNSYYSKERIEQIVGWVLEEKFQDFHFFIGEGMWFYNFQSFGYDPVLSQKKMKEKNQQLLSKLKPILKKYNVSEEKIIRQKVLQLNPHYPLLLARSHVLIDQDAILAKILREISLQLRNTGQQPTSVYPELAMKGFALELPLLLNTPGILQVPSSLFVYHQNNNMYEYLYTTAKLQYATQGFAVLKFE